MSVKLLPEVRPALRGWLHAVTFPVALVAGLVLVVLASSQRARVAVAVYTFTAALLFGVSALYHRGSWSDTSRLTLRRIDHANIFLIIAGTYTPLCVLLVRGPARPAILIVVWLGALTGVLLSVAWPHAPRWLIVPVYVALGWVALFVLPQLLHHGGVALVVLTIGGGALYTAGGLVYGLRRPNLVPGTFGFHELFHAFTVLAFAAQYAAVAVAVART
jgi:hemolysin III